MRIRVLIYSVLTFLALDSIAQLDNKEKVYLHLSSHSLLAGESLYYTAYCQSELTGKPSELSKILYLEIVGAKGPVHQEKILLESGRGDGEFFISSMIPSGKYQVIAYTRWMKNFDAHFRTSLDIINPFEAMPPSENSHAELDVDFFDSEEGLVAGIKNTMGLRITNGAMPEGQYKGKIVSSSGETVSSFSNDAYGFAQFNIVPKLNESYNVVLEDKLGKFHFFEIPATRPSGTIIEFKANDNTLNVMLHSTTSDGRPVTLIVYDGQREIFRTKTSLNTNINIDTRNLDGRLLNIVINNAENKTVATRKFFIPKTPSSEIAVNQTYDIRTMVKPMLALEAGTYSISIRKQNQYLVSYHDHVINSNWHGRLENFPVDPVEYLSETSGSKIEAYLQRANMKELSTQLYSTNLPEYRNEFIDGQLLGKDNQPVSDEIVALSIIGKNPQIRTSKTNINGVFSIPFDLRFEDHQAFVTPISLDSTFRIITTSSFLSKYPNFNYSLTPFDSSQVGEIVEKSVKIQIENAYYIPDSSNSSQSKILPQIPFNSTYILDDYTRFSTLKETFVEYIPSTNVRENRIPKIKPNFQTIPEESKNLPLLLLDGLPVTDNDILAFGTNNIESINILNNRFFLGPLISDGVILFQTFEGDLGRFKTSSYHHKTIITGVSSGETYSFPNYQAGIKNKRPDQRDQLYWNPKLVIGESETTSIEFFTSDVTGQFEMILEGYTNKGEAISLIKSFIVN
jgi:hypothetical protein